jgi:hypothetical protein
MRAAGLFAGLVLVTLVGTLALGALPSIGPSNAVQAPPLLQTPWSGTVSQAKSLNWVGYADIASTNTVTYVSGAWVEPKVSCPVHGTLYAAFWVGIDGANSNTVEQTGTLAMCSSGTASYQAWWELYPSNYAQTITSITVHANDSFSASVKYTGSAFTMFISDLTTGKKFSKTGTQAGVARSSAECVGERPEVGSSLAALARFGTMKFSSCTATISGKTAGIGSYSSVDEITMVDSGGTTLAAPSGLSNSGKTFSITWHKAT